MRIKGSVVVVTGASSGIGRAVSLAMAKRGAAVVLAARRADALEEVAVACAAHGAEALVVPTDVSDAAAVDELARRAVERFGRIDVWVNDAAVTLFGRIEEVPLEDVRRVLDVNVMGYVHGVRAALPHLRAQGSGVIVNVASVVGVVSQPYTAAYTMSKFAIRALTASVRQELVLDGARRIKVVSVLPAAIDTPLFAHAANHTGRKVLAMPPVYTAERVARAVVNQVRVPRREVIAGSVGRPLILQSTIAPGTVEKAMAHQVDRAHLSRRHSARPTSGNLHRPASGTGSVAGGWHGRRRTNLRRLASAALVVGAAARLRGQGR